MVPGGADFGGDHPAANELLDPDCTMENECTGTGIALALKPEWLHCSTPCCNWGVVLSYVERQQLCCIRIDPQVPPICLQQARSAASIWADGMAHAIVGASRDSISRILLSVRLSRSM